MRTLARQVGDDELREEQALEHVGMNGAAAAVGIGIFLSQAEGRSRHTVR